MEIINASPFIERKVDSLWDRATKVRDRIYSDLLISCSEYGIDPLVVKSNPSVYPLWVEMQLWIPQSENSLTARSKITVTIQPKPYHRFDMEFDVEIINQGRVKSYKRLRELNKSNIHGIILYFLGKAPHPKFPRNKLRRFFFQFWRAKNKIPIIRPDWTRHVAWLLMPILVFGQDFNFTVASTLFKLIIILNIISIWRLHKRPKLVLTTAKPYEEPRLILPFDYWHTVLFDMADECQNLRERFIKILEKFPSDRFDWKKEKISYLGLDTLEERDQYVLTFNRGILFVHIHQYGDGLYIGWDAYLNFGNWVETQLATGVHRENGRLTSVQSIIPGDHFICEYDLADLNCLIEWSHGNLTKMIKEFLAEKKIDQEIDFKILRGDRERVFAGQRSGKNLTFDSARGERTKSFSIRERWRRSSDSSSSRAQYHREGLENR
jgi:hypothetical protein